MSLKIGGSKIKDLRIGNKKVLKVFVGSKQVWPETSTPISDEKHGDVNRIPEISSESVLLQYGPHVFLLTGTALYQLEDLVPNTNTVLTGKIQEIEYVAKYTGVGTRRAIANDFYYDKTYWRAFGDKLFIFDPFTIQAIDTTNYMHTELSNSLSATSTDKTHYGDVFLYNNTYWTIGGDSVRYPIVWNSNGTSYIDKSNGITLQSNTGCMHTIVTVNNQLYQCNEYGVYTLDPDTGKTTRVYDFNWKDYGTGYFTYQSLIQVNNNYIWIVYYGGESVKGWKAYDIENQKAVTVNIRNGQSSIKGVNTVDNENFYIYSQYSYSNPTHSYLKFTASTDNLSGTSSSSEYYTSPFGDAVATYTDSNATALSGVSLSNNNEKIYCAISKGSNYAIGTASNVYWSTDAGHTYNTTAIPFADTKTKLFANNDSTPFKAIYYNGYFYMLCNNKLVVLS